MAKTMKKLAVWLLTISMLLGMVGIPAFAAEEPAAKYPEVTVKLIPGETTNESADLEVDGGKLTRKVGATTSEVVATSDQTPAGVLTAPQSALKFDRNSTTDQSGSDTHRSVRIPSIMCLVRP